MNTEDMKKVFKEKLDELPKYEMRVGMSTKAYGFSTDLKLSFDTLPEVLTAIQVMADVVLGHGDAGSAIMITKVSKPDAEQAGESKAC